MFSSQKLMLNKKKTSNSTTMFFEFFSKEIDTAIRKPMIYIFFFVMMLLVFGAVVSDNIQIGGSIGNVYKNAPHVITIYTSILSIFGLLIATAFFNGAALKDYDNNFNEILFSTPIKKSAYFFGRFFGALLLSTIPLLGIYAGFALGAELGPKLGWIDADRIGQFYPESFFNNYFLFILPNMFFAGAVVFALANKWKSTVISFVGSLVIIIAYIISGSLLSDIDNETIGALLDTFGIRAYSIDSKYFTPIEKNTISAGFSGLLLINRLIWIAFGTIILMISYFSFSFINKQKKSKGRNQKEEKKINPTGLILPKATTSFGFSTEFRQFRSFFYTNLVSIIKSTTFKILFVFSAIILISNLFGGFEYFGLQSYPVTYKMMDLISGVSSIFIIIVLVFFSGELIWRDRSSHINEVIDATPHSSFVSLFAKAISLVVVAALINLFLMLISICYQLIVGYSNIELGVYLKNFFVNSLPWYITWGIILTFIQVIINNKYVGYFISVLILFLLDLLFLMLDVQTNLLNIGGTPALTYSDMNEFGAAIVAVNWFNLYWILFSLMILSIAGLFWVRGTTGGFKTRLKSAKKHFSSKYALGFGVVTILWIATASFVYYNTQVLNKYKTSDQQEEGQVEYEKQYKKYEGIAHPILTDAHYHIDIFPKERKVLIKTAAIVKNITTQPIDSLHYTINESWNMKIHIKGAELVYNDKDLGYQIYKLAKPLLPNQKLPVVYESSYASIGIENEISNTSVIRNGSFFNNFDFLPSVGYQDSYEIGDKNDRKKYDLPEKLRMPLLEEKCTASCNKNYLTNGSSDWVNVETFISTSNDQIAIAPGSLIKEWKKDGRNYYHYKTDHPSQNFFSFMSANYQVARKKWNGIDIEVYYDQKHSYNINMMLNAIENSLKYYTKNFGPYYHKQARIIEFPRYANFAQAFPGTMPYSEGFGFIIDLEDEADNNVIDAVIAHEMAHQWWAHQEVSANMQGATMITESFAEYSSLMVMKNLVKDDLKMKNFLKYDLNRYLRGRSSEVEKELPLYKVENQTHIHYGKGSVILYALQDYIGEEKVNNALKSFLEEFRYKAPPYPTSLDFLKHLETQVPDSLNYLITDWFKEITLYDFRLKEANYKKINDNNFEVTLNIEAYKLKADTIGNEEKVALNEWVDIGVYADNDEEKLMYQERVKFNQEKMTFSFHVDSIPAKAAIDPRRILIEREYSDNSKSLSEKN